MRLDCPMEQYTTFRVGGRAEAICFPNELSLLRQMVSFLTRSKIPYLIIGNGSNLLVKDGGIKGVVIVLKGGLADMETPGDDDGLLLAGGGLAVPKLLSFCIQRGLSGLEFLAGIPGTVGGAVFMNAGAFGKETGSMVQEIHVVTEEGEEAVIKGPGLSFSYRESSVPRGAVIYGVSGRANSYS